MRSSHLQIVVLLSIFGLATGCSTDRDDDTADDDASDDDSEGLAEWSIELVEQGDVGLQARLAIGADDTVAVAYRANQPYEDGICTEVPVNPPPRLRQELFLAWRSPGDTSWTIELVDEPVVAFTPTGSSLAFDHQDQPAIAYQGGDPQGQFCGANDALLAVREVGGWAYYTASTISADHVTGQALSDTGFVVGNWPGLAFDPGGWPAILHRDTHFGSLQSEDLLAADAEFAWFDGAAWIYDTADVGDGGGKYGSLVFDPQGRPVAFHAITIEAQQDSRHGLWAARREAYEQWTPVRLHTGAIHQEISAAIDPVTGALVVAFYSAADKAVVVRRLTDHEQFENSGAWDQELVGTPQYDEGQHVSLAFTPTGQTALAYHRCRSLSAGSGGCDPNDEAVIFALRETDGWSIEVVREAEIGSCGEYTSLGIDSDGIARIAFRCTIEIDDGFEFRLYVASREI